MNFAPRSTWLCLFAVLATAVLTCCSPSSPSGSCPPAYSHATFQLTVRAIDGLLPKGVVITVKYGSGKEVYDADHPNQSPQVVFCKQSFDGGGVTDDASVDDASSSGLVEAIVCDLWTDGAATVRVEGQGYPEVERNLVADTDDCGLKLSEETIVIEPGD